MNINERIKEIRKTLCKDSNVIFANRLNKNTNTTSNYTRSEYSIGRAVVNDILAVFPEVNSEWLLTGGGQMLKPPTQEEISPSKQAGEISIPQEAWAIIRDQAASLKAKDEQLNKVIAMLEDQLNKKGETAGNAGAAVG